MNTTREIRRMFALALVTGGLAALAGFPAAASADAGCALYAAPDGNDANPGTKAEPKASPIVLLEALGPGQTGCLKDGATFTLGGGDAITSTGGNPGQPKILRPETPGKRVTIDAATGFWFKAASHDITLKDLNLRRSTGGGGSLILLDGDRLTLDGIDATYAYNICLDIGQDPRAGAVDSTDDLVIRRSRIHDCGSSYGPPHFQNDSGVHGIYVQFTRRALIEDNLIYANHNRGIQLYPDADGTTIRNDVLYGNGANLNIGSERDQAIFSEGNLVENNIIADSTLDGLQPGGFVGDTSEVLGNFPPPGPGVPDFANSIVRNCVSNATYPGELYEGYGFTHASNIENQDPLFVDAAGGDFTLRAGSPCVGKGPRPLTAGPVTLDAPVTDNYKACFNGNPDVQEKRTWLQFGHTITAAGISYRPSALPGAGSTFSGSVALSGNDGSTADATIATIAGNTTYAKFRVDASGVWGPLVELVNPADLKNMALQVRITIVRDGATVGSTTLEYRYEDALATALRPPADCFEQRDGIKMEWNSPGGRWWLKTPKTATRTTWEPAPTCQGRPATIFGGTGDDALTGTTGDDVIAGGAGADTIRAADGADSICGGDGDDTLDGGPGADRSVGDDGIDLATYAGRTSSVTVSLDGNANDGDPTLAGGGEKDNVLGTVENVTAGGGNDILVGSGGANVLTGGGGDDVLRGRAGADKLVGGAGADRVDYSGASGPVTVNLGTQSASGAEGADTLSTLERVTGSSFADTLTGDKYANSLAGGGGNDTIAGGFGRDVFFGDGWNDAITSRDDVGETVSCGAGGDRVTADALDTAAADCETVSR